MRVMIDVVNRECPTPRAFGQGMWPVLLLLLVAACPGRRPAGTDGALSDPDATPDRCPSAERDLDPAACLEVPPKYGLSRKAPLEWGLGATGTLWFGRLVCPGGADPDVVRLGSISTKAPRSDSPPSGVPNFGGDILDAWSVSCPGGPEEQTWYSNMYRCGNPCPPEGFSVMSAEGMRLWLASRKAYDAGRSADAHQLAREAAEAWPASERIQYWLGVTALDQRDLHTALDAFGRAVEWAGSPNPVYDDLMNGQMFGQMVERITVDGWEPQAALDEFEATALETAEKYAA